MGWVAANDFLKANLEYQSSIELEDTPKRRKYPFPEWHLKAACANEEETTFFGAKDTSERPALSMSGVQQAKNICAGCPVMETCLRTALGVGEDSNREEYGIWAGTSGRTRRRIWELVDSQVVEMERVISDIMSGKEAKYERKVTFSHSQIEVIPVRRVTA